MSRIIGLAFVIILTIAVPAMAADTPDTCQNIGERGAVHVYGWFALGRVGGYSYGFFMGIPSDSEAETKQQRTETEDKFAALHLTAGVVIASLEAYCARPENKTKDMFDAAKAVAKQYIDLMRLYEVIRPVSTPAPTSPSATPRSEVVI